MLSELCSVSILALIGSGPGLEPDDQESRLVQSAGELPRRRGSGTRPAYCGAGVAVR